MAFLYFDIKFKYIFFSLELPIASLIDFSTNWTMGLVNVFFTVPEKMALQFAYNVEILQPR